MYHDETQPIPHAASQAKVLLSQYRDQSDWSRRQYPRQQIPVAVTSPCRMASEDGVKEAEPPQSDIDEVSEG